MLLPGLRSRCAQGASHEQSVRRCGLCRLQYGAPCLLCWWSGPAHRGCRLCLPLYPTAKSQPPTAFDFRETVGVLSENPFGYLCEAGSTPAAHAPGVRAGRVWPSGHARAAPARPPCRYHACPKPPESRCLDVSRAGSGTWPRGRTPPPRPGQFW